MDVDHVKDGKTETITFSQRPPLLPIILLAVAALVVIETMIVVSSHEMPIPLLVMFVIISLNCVWLGAVAADQIKPASLTLTPEGLEISRLLGSQTIDWTDIGEIRVVPSSGSFSDPPNRDGISKIAVGLFLRSSTKARADTLDADILVAGADKAFVKRLEGVVASLSSYQRKAVSGEIKQQKRIAKSIKPTGQFRRPRGEGEPAPAR